MWYTLKVEFFDLKNMEMRGRFLLPITKYRKAWLHYGKNG